MVSLPFLDSNINREVCYLVFYSQILRYERLCSLLRDFNDRTNKLGNILLNRGYDYKRLEKEFTRVVSKYRQEFERWEVPTNARNWFADLMKP